MENKKSSIVVISALIIVIGTIIASVIYNKNQQGYTSEDGKEIVSCNYNEGENTNGGHYWINLHFAEDDENQAMININKSDSWNSPEVIQNYTADPKIFDELEKTIDQYGMKKWSNKKISDSDSDDESSTSLLIRFSDETTLYLSGQSITDDYANGFRTVKNSILSFAKNENSHLKFEKKKSKAISTPTVRGLSLRAEEFENGYITVYVTNSSGVDAEFKNNFTLSRLNGDSWKEYTIKDDAVKPEISSFEIKDMQIVKLTLDLNIYGKLSSGEHRITLDNMNYDFLLK